jgi:ABC-type multidrug transport system fused ATPase/permease subunit
MAKGVQTFLAGTGSLRFMVERLDTAQFSAEQPSRSDAAPPTNLREGIRFEDVRYRYPGSNDRLVLDGISLEIPAGRLTAIVGPSGAGKSTLIDLIPAMRLAESGGIFIDGGAIDMFDRSKLRQKIAFVPQFPQLLADTIADHIRFSRPDADDDAVVAASRLAGAHEFIEATAEGYASPLGENGVGLSGGQRQRLDLARALLQQRPILILDEPASNLDAESEQAFRIALRRIRQTTDTTIVLIAHRFASVLDADRIIVMKDGKVAASGTHSELLAAGGWYAQAFKKGELDGDVDSTAAESSYDDELIVH